MGQLKVSIPSDLELRTSRSFKAPRQLVWNAHTQPELLKQWLLGPPGWSMHICEVDLRVGGQYRFGWSDGNGNAYGLSGEYRGITEPSELITTVLFDGAPDGTSNLENLQTLELREEPGGTLLVTTMRFHSKEARDEALASGMNEGMEACCQVLDGILATLQQ
jgi:uncharacterized protein YndB with AHSA1/START domain